MSPTRPLRIGLDIGWLGVKAEGIRHWTEQTFARLIRDNPNHQFTLIWPWPHADAEACSRLTGPNVELFVIRPRSLLRRVGRRLHILSEPDRVIRRLGRLDVLHWAGYAETCFEWLHKLPGVPKAVTTYDAIPVALPDTQAAGAVEQWQKHLARVKATGSWWLTISDHARADLGARAGLDPARGTVVYPGHNFDGTDGRPVPDGPLPADLAAAVGGNPYLLTVGTLEPRKNHVRLFRAFAALTARPAFADWKLVAVGGRGWLDEPILAEAAKTPGVVLAGRRSHAELAGCYRHAAAFAFPSLYEGFGLPVAEALSFGLPTLTSTTTSLPEVAGEAAVLVDPTDDDALRAGLARVMADEPLRAGLREAARVRAARFSWDRAARETMQFLERAAAGGAS